jgi:Xaa-Pro aminopeptidase
MIAERVQGLRTLMAERGIQAYIVPSTDDHQDEYVPDCWQRRRWISGFTGSAGTAVITQDQAGLWTDGRYHVQAAQELDPTVFTLFPVGLPDVKEVGDWLAVTLRKGQVVAMDPKVVSMEEAQRLREKLDPNGITICFLVQNLVDLLWEDRPPRPADPIRVLPESFSGESVPSKLSRVQQEMDKVGVHAHIISTLDGVAWLFNLRGSDIPYNPLFIAYALVTRDEAMLFIDPVKDVEAVRSALQGLVSFHPYEAIQEVLVNGVGAGWRLWIDPRATSQWIYGLIQGGPAPVERQSPVITFKAVKNPVEQEGMRACHIRDGAAVVRFLRWLHEAVEAGGVTELSAAARLDRCRAEVEHFQGLSFETIAGYQGHGAIIHYRPSSQTDCEIQPEGLLLVDSGGHYLDGTTDVTRTIALGPPSQEQRERFTRVLKGHIQLLQIKFPRGTTGKQLDSLARKHLWEVGLDYRHGTGHGVGAFLNVHEGPQSLSPRDPGVPLEPGMFLSNEPGYYQEGAYGIRIESVMMVREAKEFSTEYGQFCRFEPVTLVPIDLRLVDPQMLSPQEKVWLNGYHAQVLARLSPHLSGDDRRWLEAATRPI